MALGADLFARSPRGYSLTSTGEQLMVYAESVESSAADILNDVAGEKFSLTGAVRIGAPDGFGTFFLARRLGNLVLRHPQLELELVAMPRVFNLTSREADIAIGLRRPEKGRLFSRKLTDYSLHLYASQSYLDSTDPIISKRDLSKHNVLGYIPDLIFAPELDYLNDVGELASPRLSSTSLIAQVQATQAGAGLCILPDFIAFNLPGLVRVLPKQIKLLRTFWIMAHLDARKTARIRTVVDFIAELSKSERQRFLPD